MIENITHNNNVPRFNSYCWTAVGATSLALITALAVGIIFGPLAALAGFCGGAVVGALLGAMGHSYWTFKGAPQEDCTPAPLPVKDVEDSVPAPISFDSPISEPQNIPADAILAETLDDQVLNSFPISDEEQTSDSALNDDSSVIQFTTESLATNSALEPFERAEIADVLVAWGIATTAMGLNDFANQAAAAACKENAFGMQCITNTVINITSGYAAVISLGILYVKVGKIFHKMHYLPIEQQNIAYKKSKEFIQIITDSVNATGEKMGECASSIMSASGRIVDTWTGILAAEGIAAGAIGLSNLANQTAPVICRENALAVQCLPNTLANIGLACAASISIGILGLKAYRTLRQPAQAT